MNIKQIMNKKDEKPLEHLLDDGGFTSIFRTIGCIGDSLSSGEFESLNDLGEKEYHDFFEYSWGQYLGRMIGSRVYNFSRGGMTGVEYVQTFADSMRYWDPKYACQAYIIALGVNDLVNHRCEVGSFDDINYSDYRQNNVNTFIGSYAYIIRRLQEMQPRAKFFLMTMPQEHDENDIIRAKHREILYYFSKQFKNVYLIDLFEYGPVYDDEFKEYFYMGHHLNPMGYVLTSKLVATYIDYIIRHHYQDFKEVGYIGTDLRYYKND